MNTEARPTAIEGLASREQLVRGLNLAILEGPRTGPTLVLLAGMMDLWTDYKAVLPQLMQRFHVLMVEHRGHGASQWASDGCYRVNDYADDLIAFLDASTLDPVYIAGNSLGGLIALDVAARRPEWVRAIVLEDAPLLVCEGRQWALHWLYPMFTSILEVLKRWRASNGGQAALAQGLATIGLYRPRLEMDEHSRAIAAERMTSSLTAFAGEAAERARLLAGWQRYRQGDRPTLGECLPKGAFLAMASVLSTVDPRAPQCAADLRLNEGFNHLEALRSVRCPVLLMEADRILGGIVPPESIELIKASLRQIPHRHVLVEGAGHHIHCDAPARFIAETTAFLIEC